MLRFVEVSVGDGLHRITMSFGLHKASAASAERRKNHPQTIHGTGIYAYIAPFSPQCR